jgi:hypothetical protein
VIFFGLLGPRRLDHKSARRELKRDSFEDICPF